MGFIKFALSLVFLTTANSQIDLQNATDQQLMALTNPQANINATVLAQQIAYLNAMAVTTQPTVTQPIVTQPTVTQPTVTQPIVTQPTGTQPQPSLNDTNLDWSHYLNNLPNISSCICVPNSECINGVINTTGQGRFQARSYISCPAGQTCCIHPDSIRPTTLLPTVPPVTQPTQPTVTQPAVTEPAVTQPAITQPAVTEPAVTQPAVTQPAVTQPAVTQPTVTQRPTQNHGSCGTSGSSYLDRGGFGSQGKAQEAGPEEFVWTIAVYKNNKYHCGGSLIHPRAVLTSAHNVRRQKPSRLRARAGEHDRTNEDEALAHQETGVAKIVIHDNYDMGLKANDAALLFLESEFTFGPNVGVVCLPPLSFETAPGTDCVVSGWGATRVGGQLVDRKKMVELPIVARDTCEAAIKSQTEIRISANYKLPLSMICAGGEAGSDTCKGDGGGPLVCAYTPDEERYYQAGIASWGVGCGAAGRPGVYTSAASVRGWVDRIMLQEGLGTASYTAPDN